MAPFRSELHALFLCSVQPVWNEENSDEFLDSHTPLNRKVLEPDVDRTVEDLHELHRVFGSPGSRFWHERKADPLVFMAHLLFFRNKL